MRSGFDLQHLRVFLAVVDHGGFGRAARVLGAAQSTVSESVRALERALGAPVITRAGRRVEPTAAGEALLPYARELLRVAGEAAAAVSRVAEHARATLTVAAPESVGAALLPQAIAKVRSRFPGTRFRIESALCEDIRAAAQAGRIDLGIVMEPAGGPLHESDELLAHVPLVVFASPEHRLAGLRARADDLWPCRFVFAEPGGYYHTILRRFFEEAGYPLPEIEVVGSVEAVRRTVLTDPTALGALPSFAIEPDLRDGRARSVCPASPLAPLALKALRAGAAERSPPAAALVEELGRAAAV